jgi:hypothetical protein
MTLDSILSSSKNLKGLEGVIVRNFYAPKTVDDIETYFPKVKETLFLPLRPGILTQLHTLVHQTKKINLHNVFLLYFYDGLEEDGENIYGALKDYPDPFDFQDWCIDNGYEGSL